MTPYIHTLIFLFSAIFLHAQETSTIEEVADTLNLWGLIKQGGWAMYPLGMCSIVMFFLIFYSWKETTRKKFFIREQVNVSLNTLEKEGTHEDFAPLEASDTLLARAVVPALKRFTKVRTKAKACLPKIWRQKKIAYPNGSRI